MTGREGFLYWASWSSIAQGTGLCHQLSEQEHYLQVFYFRVLMAIEAKGLLTILKNNYPINPCTVFCHQEQQTGRQLKQNTEVRHKLKQRITSSTVRQSSGRLPRGFNSKAGHSMELLQELIARASQLILTSTMGHRVE